MHDRLPASPEPTVVDQSDGNQRMMDAVRDRAGAALLSTTLESRTPSLAVHDCGLPASETFVFAVRIASGGEHTVRLPIRVSADLAIALAEEHPESADMLVAAWSELTTLADQLNEEACRGGLEAERARRLEAVAPSSWDRA